MKKCLKRCVDLKVSCPNKECRSWIDYEQDYNCVFWTVQENGEMTLREVAKRLNISFVRVKQLEDQALKKIAKLNKQNKN